MFKIQIVCADSRTNLILLTNHRKKIKNKIRDALSALLIVATVETTSALINQRFFAQTPCGIFERTNLTYIDAGGKFLARHKGTIIIDYQKGVTMSRAVPR